MTWLGISTEELFNGIVERSSCNKGSAESLVKEICYLDASLCESFRCYWETGKIDTSLSVGDFSIGNLIEKRQMHPLGAFAALDWLIKEPENANKALKRPYDRIIYDEQSLKRKDS